MLGEGRKTTNRCKKSTPGVEGVRLTYRPFALITAAMFVSLNKEKATIEDLTLPEFNLFLCNGNTLFCRCS